jgi:molybdopterin-guanine dinucleotide biosynthesis protein A
VAEFEGGVTAIILSGGRGRRLNNQDKGLVEWKGRPLIRYVIDCLAPQVDEIIISSNRNVDEYAAFGYEVVSDADPEFQGPIAGMLAGLECGRGNYMLVCPCDSPNLPDDLVTRLGQGLENADIAVAHDGIQRQNLVALMKGEVVSSLRSYYDGGGRAVKKWLPGERVEDIDFSAQPEAFLNINSPSDLAGQ